MAIMRSSVDSPQPDEAAEDDVFAVPDVDVDTLMIAAAP
jgi:hypothetical protein